MKLLLLLIMNANDIKLREVGFKCVQTLIFLLKSFTAKSRFYNKKQKSKRMKSEESLIKDNFLKISLKVLLQDLHQRVQTLGKKNRQS